MAALPDGLEADYQVIKEPGPFSEDHTNEFTFLEVSRGKTYVQLSFFPSKDWKKVNTLVFTSRKWDLVVEEGKGDAKGNLYSICASL